MSINNTSTEALPQKPALGAALMVGAMVVLPMMDSTVKLLMESLPFPQVVFLRYIAMTLIILPIILFLYKKEEILRVERPVMQVVRGALMFAATFLFFGAINAMPLADAVALAFVAPMLTTVLSALFLKEQVGIRRYAAVFIGFIGVLIIIRPGTETFSVPAMMALGCSLAMGFFNIVTRSIASSSPPLISLFYTGVTGSIMGAFVAPFFWEPMVASHFGLAAVIGTLGMFGHGLLIMSFRYGEASFVAPFIYFEMITATVLGYLVFGDFPDQWVWVGVSILVISGIYTNYRERSHKLPVSPPKHPAPLDDQDRSV